MGSMREQLRDKITNLKEFNIAEETLKKETKKKKNWTTPGIDGIKNFWWKRLNPARRGLKRALEQIKDNDDLLPVWWPSGRTELLPKTKDLTDEKNYHPITCLNTSYKLLTSLVSKYMREHTMENEMIFGMKGNWEL